MESYRNRPWPARGDQPPDQRRDPLASLSSTCRSLHKRYRNESLQARFIHWDTSELRYQLFLLLDATEGAEGYLPFRLDNFFLNGKTVLGAKKDRLEDGHFSFMMKEHPLWLRCESDRARFKLPILMTETEVKWNRNYEGGAFPEWFKMSWETMRDQMVVATRDMMRDRFVCPECDGSGQILYTKAGSLFNR